MKKTVKVTGRPTAWTFVSGKIAALEAELLPRAVFDAILKAPGPAEARVALGKSSYRALFPDDESLAAVSSLMDGMAKETRAEIFTLCPPHPLANYFGVGSRFRSFRTLFNGLSRQAGAQAPALDALFPVFAVEPAYADAMAEHRNLLERKNPPQAAAPVERSLYLDSAACTLMRIVAASAPEPLVRRYLDDRATLAAWSGVFRARWNGVAADTIRNWFVFGGAPGFAPERVLSYLVAIEAEMVNVELSLSAVNNGIDRGTAAARLRRGYA